MDSSMQMMHTSCSSGSIGGGTIDILLFVWIVRLRVGSTGTGVIWLKVEPFGFVRIGRLLVDILLLLGS